MKKTEHQMQSELNSLMDIYGTDLLSAPTWAFNQITVLSTKIASLKKRKKLGTILKQWRSLQGLSVGELGKTTGLHVDLIKKIEAGENQGYTVDSLFCILDALCLNFSLTHNTGKVPSESTT